MAGSVTSITGRFDADTRDKANLARKISQAVFGAGSAAQRQTARAELFKQPDFIVTARQDVAGETTTILDLTAKGVTFPAGTCRVIEYEAFVTGDTAATESGYLAAKNMIVGGTTPVLGIVIGAVNTNMAGAVGGFTTADPSIQFAIATANVTITVTNENATENNNWVLKVWVGPLQPVLLGI